MTLVADNVYQNYWIIRGQNPPFLFPCASNSFHLQRCLNWLYCNTKANGGSCVYCETKQVTLPRFCTAPYVILLQARLRWDPLSDGLRIPGPIRPRGEHLFRLIWDSLWMCRSERREWRLELYLSAGGVELFIWILVMLPLFVVIAVFVCCGSLSTQSVLLLRATASDWFELRGSSLSPSVVVVLSSAVGLRFIQGVSCFIHCDWTLVLSKQLL